MSGSWIRTALHTIFASPWKKFVEAEYTAPDGAHFSYSYVHLKNFVLVVALEPDGSTYLVRQFRPPLDKETWEFPAGTIEDGEDIEEAARRELAEETGLHAENMRCLGQLAALSGLTNQHCYVFLATGLTQRDPEPDGIERFLTTRRFPLATIKQMILDYEMIESPSVAALTLMALKDVPLPS